MKSVLCLSILFHVSTTFATSDSCETWPPDLKTLKECCNLPIRYTCSHEISCAVSCSDEHPNLKLTSISASAVDVGVMRTCIEDCFIQKSYLFTGDKKINKTAAKLLYHNINSFSNWTQAIEVAVDSCEMGSDQSLSFKLANYFSCVEDSLAKSCKDFIYQLDGCPATIEHYEKCQNVQTDCTIWPRTAVSPIYCCDDVPKVFSEAIISNCYEKCESSEYFKHFEYRCIHNCLFDATNVMDNNKFNFVIAKKLLLENVINTEDWITSIDIAVDSCENNERIAKGLL